jgi:hypothetical protein
MQKIISESKLSFYLVSSALILFYISDGGNKYFQLGQYANDDAIEDSFSISIYFRLLYEIFFASIILLNLNLTRRKIILAIIALILIFIIGQQTFLLNYGDPEYSIFHDFTLLNKYLYGFIIFGGIYKVVENWKDYSRLIKIYENIVVINSILVFAGLLFNITLFESYYSIDVRYGYDGLIPSVNEATLFYFIAISYFYYKHFIRKEKSWKIYMVITASLLLGTKTIYLFLLLLFIYHLITNLSLIKKIIYISLTSIVIPLLIIPVILDPRFSFLYASFTYFYDKEGFWFMITSGRSYFIQDRFVENLSHWNIINYFFGGTDQFKFMIEMDFFDLFLFLGALGSLVLFYLYYSTIFKNDNKIKFLSFFSFCYFFLAFLSGHIFSSATNALNLVLVVIFIGWSNYYGDNIQIQG